MKHAHLPHLGIIGIQGPDSATFLQGQLTYDIQALTVNTAHMAAFCNPKGRVIANFYIWRINEQDFACLLPRDNIAYTLEKLKQYAIFSKVELSDQSDSYHCYGSFALEANLSPNTLLSQDGTYQIAIDQQHAITVSAEALTSDATYSKEAWLTQLIRLKQPLVCEATREKFTPHDLDLPQLGAVSFSKGCYVGQEIIARMQHLGTPKRQLATSVVATTDTFEPGTTIHHNDKSIGTVLASSQQQHNTHLLAVIQRTVADLTCHIDHHTLVWENSTC